MLEDVQPDEFTFAKILTACASLAALEEGRRVHAQAIELRCESDVFVGSSLVDMYAKCGSIAEALKVFLTMPIRNVVTWNSLLAGYVKCDEGQKALELFALMQVEGVQPDLLTFTVVLRACASIMALEEGKRVHLRAFQSGGDTDLYFRNTLVDMYAKCGSIEDARCVFQTMPARNVVSWNTMLAGYLKCEKERQALKLFVQMKEEGMRPDSVTFVLLLNACANMMALEEGKLLHAQAIQIGCDSDVFVGNTLVGMYAKCRHIKDAQTVFHGMTTRNAISWSTMLAGYVSFEEGQKALELFALMQEEGVKPNLVTFLAVLNACASTMALETGRHLHAQIIASGCESEVFVGSALVDMYSKCGSVEDAERVFHLVDIRNVVSWNTMLAGYVKCEEGHKALQLFALMQEWGLQPDHVTFVAVLNACANVMALEEGRRVHSQVIQSGCESNLFVGNTLVDMYAKCGSIEDAQRVFHTMPVRDVVSWNSMLSGFAIHGHGKKALQLFQEMCGETLEMNEVTFISLLSACSHGGLVEEGVYFFKAMHSLYGVSPTVEHYACMVDLLGRAGRLSEAEDLLRSEPKISEASIPLMSLLRALSQRTCSEVNLK